MANLEHYTQNKKYNNLTQTTSTSIKTEKTTKIKIKGWEGVTENLSREESIYNY